MRCSISSWTYNFNLKANIRRKKAEEDNRSPREKGKIRRLNLPSELAESMQGGGP